MKSFAEAAPNEKFKIMQGIESNLEIKIEGYQGVLTKFDTLKAYRAHFNNDFPIREKIRVSEFVRLHKDIQAFEKKYEHTPLLDAKNPMPLSEQLSGIAKLAEQGIRLHVSSDNRTGEMIIHNMDSNSHTIIDFDLMVNHENGNGSIKLSEVGREMFPLLDKIFRSEALIEKNEEGKGFKAVDKFVVIDALTNKVYSTKALEQMIRSTRPVTLSYGGGSDGTGLGGGAGGGKPDSIDGYSPP